MKAGKGRAAEWRLTLHKCDVTGEKVSCAFMRWQDGKMHFTVWGDRTLEPSPRLQYPHNPIESLSPIKAFNSVGQKW